MSAEKQSGHAEDGDIAVQGTFGGDIDAQSSMGEAKGDVRLDHYGYALVPQPSHFRDDPLVRCTVQLGSVLDAISLAHIA